MRVYRGSPDDHRVWVTHVTPDGPSDLRDLVDQFLDVDRKPPSTALHHRVTGSVDGLSWGDRGAGGAALAASILAGETGEEPTPLLARVFRDDVVARIPHDEPLDLPATAVWHWIEQHRLLVEAELFNTTGPAYRPADSDATIAEGEELPPATASALVAACERAWDAIRDHHPDLPDAVIVIGSGVERGRLVKLGHWWGGRWIADGATRGEVLLAGEALHQPADDVFEVLLHEAAHALNAARGIKDTSRGGRYHNQHFKKTAEEVLLRVRATPPHGLARTLLTDDARDRYAVTIDHLGDAMRIARRIDQPMRAVDDDKTAGDRDRQPGSDGKAKSQSTTCTCGCGRKLRMAPTVLAAGPVRCGICDTDFTPANQPRLRPFASVVDNDQRARIETALDRLIMRIADTPLPLELPPNTGPLATLDPLQPTPGELDQLKAWYRSIGTPDEAPISVGDAADAARLTALARAVLAADGTLQGDQLHAPATGRGFRAGDRVIVTQPNTDIDAGTLGVIEAISRDDQLLRVDFPTAGRLDAHIDGVLAAALDHDYATVDTTALERLEVGTSW